MSIALMTAAWALDIPATDKLVLLALADNANDAGCCWPSMATIARKCGLKERATRIAMRRLEQAGHVTSLDRSGTSRLYTVHPGTKCPPASNAPRHEMPVTPASDAPKPSRTVISSTETSSPTKKRARAKQAEQMAPLPAWVPADAWNGWVAMRAKLRKPLTPYAARKAIEQLEKLKDHGQPPGDVIDQSTLKCWLSFHPIKDHRNGLSPRHNHSGLGGHPGGGADRAPRRGYACDLYDAALALPEAAPEGDLGDRGGAEDSLSAYLRKRP